MKRAIYKGIKQVQVEDVPDRPPGPGTGGDCQRRIRGAGRQKSGWRNNSGGALIHRNNCNKNEERDRPKMKSNVFLLLLATITLWSCAAALEQARTEHFNKYGDRYRISLMHGEYGQAASMIDPADRKAIDFEKMKEIKIVDYKVTSMITSEDHNEIRQDVELQYFLKSQNLLKSVQYQQLWQYKDDGRAWLLKTDLPTFKF